MPGDVAAVEAAVEAGSATAADNGLLVGNIVIPSPVQSVFEQMA